VFNEKNIFKVNSRAMIDFGGKKSLALHRDSSHHAFAIYKQTTNTEFYTEMFRREQFKML
jgi:hypothetical protein